MENNKSGKFPPSALIKAVGENLPSQFFFFLFIYFFILFYFKFKAEGGNFHKKRGARVCGGSNWDSLKVGKNN